MSPPPPARHCGRFRPWAARGPGGVRRPRGQEALPAAPRRQPRRRAPPRWRRDGRLDGRAARPRRLLRLSRVGERRCAKDADAAARVASVHESAAARFANTGADGLNVRRRDGAGFRSVWTTSWTRRAGGTAKVRLACVTIQAGFRLAWPETGRVRRKALAGPPTRDCTKRFGRALA